MVREDLPPANRNPSVKLFGTSGIRGSAGKFLSTNFAERLGRTFAAFLEGRGNVYVGRDVRLHSKSILLQVVGVPIPPDPIRLLGYILPRPRETAKSTPLDPEK